MLLNCLICTDSKWSKFICAPSVRASFKQQ